MKCYVSSVYFVCGESRNEAFLTFQKKFKDDKHHISKTGFFYIILTQRNQPNLAGEGFVPLGLSLKVTNLTS